jgi:phage replication O-like protein O
LVNPQKENGYTPIANEILEVLAKTPLNGTQRRIIDVIWRYTYGFNRKAHELSENFISKAIDCDRRQVRRELNLLIDYKIISVKKEATFKSSREVEFNKYYDNWDINKPQRVKTNTGGENAPSPGGEIMPSPGGENVPQERHNLKTILKKDIYTLEFEEFYKLYPNPQNKQRSFKNWKKQLKTETVERLMQATTNYKKLVEVENRERQYIKSSANFFGQENFFIDYLPENFKEPQKKQDKPQQRKNGFDNFTSRYEADPTYSKRVEEGLKRKQEAERAVMKENNNIEVIMEERRKAKDGKALEEAWLKNSRENGL